MDHLFFKACIVWVG